MQQVVYPFVSVPIPGDKAKKIIQIDDAYMMTATKASPLAIKRGEGIVLEDEDGNIFYDFTSGVGVCNTGHCHPKIVQAIKKQAESLIHFAGTDYYYEVQSLLLKTLAGLAPGNFKKKVFLTNSGTESIEAAIKISRFYSKRPNFISFIGAFHGRTMGSLSLTCSKSIHKKGFSPSMPGVINVPYAYCYRCPYKQKVSDCNYYCAEIIEDLYFKHVVDPEDVAAIFVEPIQGEGGYIVPPKGFIQKIKEICEKYGILYVSDEIQAGFGRTGKFFGIENFDVVPDIITTAKGMGSGLPIGGVIFNAKYDFPYKGAHSNTFGGNPVCCASSLATIDVLINDGVIENARIVGDYFHNKLLELENKHELIGDVRGIGLMQGIEIVKNKETKEIASAERDNIIEECLNNGLITIGCGSSSIRYIPPLIIKKEEVDIAINIIDKAITNVEKNRN
jgi:4-aminobutyrate aminotransferase